VSKKKLTVTVARHPAGAVIPIGTKVYDSAGKEVGEVTSWAPSAKTGFVEAQAAITDPELIALIESGGNQTFSMSAKIAVIAVDPATRKNG